MIIDLSPDPINWMEKYDPSLVDAPNEHRYVAALYWYVRRETPVHFSDLVCSRRVFCLTLVAKCTMCRAIVTTSTVGYGGECGCD